MISNFFRKCKTKLDSKETLAVHQRKVMIHELILLVLHRFRIWECYGAWETITFTF